MAQTPGGKPRSGPATQARPTAPGAPPVRSPSPPLTGFSSPFRRTFDFQNQGASLNPTVSIRGQTYRQVDNGRANVLVPVSDPLRPPELIAQQRQAIVNSLFMAANPIAGGAYGVATLLGASPQTRDRAMTAGAVADAGLTVATPRGAHVRRPTPGRQAQVADPSWKRNNFRPSERNADGQARRVEATATASMLGTGTKARQRIRPPGFEGEAAGHARGHLFPRELGGPGNDPRNLVTLSQRPTNDPHMTSFDKVIAQKVRSGEVIEYSSTPLYTPGIKPPGAILMTATGSNGTRMAKLVHNPAGRPK